MEFMTNATVLLAGEKMRHADVCTHFKCVCIIECTEVLRSTSSLYE